MNYKVQNYSTKFSFLSFLEKESQDRKSKSQVFELWFESFKSHK